MFALFISRLNRYRSEYRGGRETKPGVGGGRGRSVRFHRTALAANNIESFELNGGMKRREIMKWRKRKIYSRCPRYYGWRKIGGQKWSVITSVFGVILARERFSSSIKTEASFLSIAVVSRHFDKTFEGKKKDGKRERSLSKTVRETRN